ncbi:uncharacterized protein LOC127286771 [Leptopilina boulardi]|uniref:uncharacterized protein LOC127286771 n=1 Tax=Leptopilina boulardi TaxID=63433 RepID=UPI0021F5BEAD|nr:uncharacterized protein LOC127286771 [Leptopilina boulardi]
MSKFWSALKSFRSQKRKKHGEGIGKKKWKRHFEILLEADDNNEVINAEGQREEEEVERAGNRNEDGEVAQNEEEKQEAEEILNRDISLEEFLKCLKKMKNGKAAGEDGIAIEFFKELDGVWKLECHETINELWKSGQIAKGWEKANISSIFKGGEENDTGNYRGVSLLDTGYKILASLMDERIREWMEIVIENLKRASGKKGQRGITYSSLMR